MPFKAIFIFFNSKSQDFTFFFRFILCEYDNSM